MTSNEPILMESEREMEPSTVTVTYSAYIYFPKGVDKYEYLQDEGMLADLDNWGFEVEDINIV